MEFTAKVIADLLSGKIEGDKNATVSSLSKIEEGTEGTLSFLANPKYLKYIYTTKSTIVIVNKDFKADKKIHTTLIRVENAYDAFAKLLNYYKQQKEDKTGIDKQASIAFDAIIGADAYVGPLAVICEKASIGKKSKIYPHVFIGENVEVGENTIIYPGVKIYPDCIIGNNCIIHAGAVIGADGFGFAPQQASDYAKVPQVGNVILEDNVEVGANTTIDRATLGSTIIRKGAKLDNLIQVAHNVEIGENTVIAAQTGLSGSTKLGKNCMVGGQVGFAGHIKIADGVKFAAQSGIPSDIKKENEVVMGYPAFNYTKYQKSYVYFRKLPDLVNRISELEKKIKELEGN
ncbi:MAG: UDP-3-O-(3-hydroxymyristoyl)glucosamine N-acyltransferase [Chlorobi bacterium]|nr:UDP-3-O-(3-hydroxymyristoyl)glucosamine N-acyltransferase [Chlorobiota bacterium]